MTPHSHPPPGGGVSELPALRKEAATTGAGAALPQAREQPQGQVPGPAGRERFAEEEGGEGEVGDDAVGEKSGGGGQRGRAEHGLGADDGAQGLRDDLHVAVGEAPAIREQPQAAVVQGA
jgi:hypothetical protein